MKKFFRILSLITLILGLNCQITFANQEIIEATGFYIMDPQIDETPAVATARAREEAKRAAIEKAGVYLQSYSKTVNFELDYDEIRTVAAKLLKIQDEKRKIEPFEENLLKFTVTIKALVEDNNDEILKTIMADKNALEEETAKYAALQKEYDALKNQMEELKRDYNSAAPAEKNQIKNSITQNNKYFESLVEWEQGNNFYFQKNYQQAVASYNRAIDLNSKFAEVYNNRGNCHVQLQNFQQALQDFQTAVKLNETDARFHNNLGSAYLVMKNYGAAIEEYTQAINLNPNLSSAYYNRALANCYLERFSDALPDARRALDLNPNDADAKNLYSQISKRLQ